MSAPTTATAQVLENAAITTSRRQIERAVSLTGRPTRRLSTTELAEAVAILQSQGCVPSEITMRLGVTR